MKKDFYVQGVSKTVETVQTVLQALLVGHKLKFTYSPKMFEPLVLLLPLGAFI